MSPTSKWWKQFGDPVLDELVDTALRNNRDLRIAAARVDQFIGALTTTGSQLYPQIGYGADASRARASAVGQPPLPPGASPYFSLYQVSMGAAWQVDLFGRIRRETEAAQALVYASEQGQRGVVLTVVSGVATSYIVLRSLDRQLEIAKATARNFGATAAALRAALQGRPRRPTEVDADQLAVPAGAARRSPPSSRPSRPGEPDLHPARPQSGPDPRGKAIDELVAPAIPGDLPVRTAAASARRPAGRAEPRGRQREHRRRARPLLPEHLHQRRPGTASTSTSALFSGPATAGRSVRGLTGPIFTFGRIKGRCSLGGGGRAPALAFYEQTVLNAFRETNDALIGSQKRLEELQAAGCGWSPCANSRGWRTAALRQGRGRLPRRPGGGERTVRRGAGRGRNCRPAATRSWSTCTRRWAAAGSTRRPSPHRSRRDGWRRSPCRKCPGDRRGEPAAPGARRATKRMGRRQGFPGCGYP
jgi:outer membrane protein, multidrug efflux system